ncbi:hypothetical protein AVEN_72683-1, partial [Araneus ventricosus]
DQRYGCDSRKCCLFENKIEEGHVLFVKPPGPVLFRIPSEENRQKIWFSALNWNVPPEKLKYVLAEDLPSTASDNLSALPSPASQCPSDEVNDTEHSCSRNILSSPTSSHKSSGHLQVTPKTRKNKTLLSSSLQVTPKTRKNKTLLSSVSKLNKRLYEKPSSSRLIGQLQDKLVDMPYLYVFF